MKKYGVPLMRNPPPPPSKVKEVIDMKEITLRELIKSDPKAAAKIIAETQEVRRHLHDWKYALSTIKIYFKIL